MSIGGRNVGFGLIIIVVTDEVFDGIIREKPLEFGVELGGQSFIVRYDQRDAGVPGLRLPW